MHVADEHIKNLTAAVEGRLTAVYDPARGRDATYRVCLGHTTIDGVSGWVAWAEYGRRGKTQCRALITTELVSVSQACQIANARMRAKAKASGYFATAAGQDRFDYEEGCILAQDAASAAEWMEAAARLQVL